MASAPASVAYITGVRRRPEAAASAPAHAVFARQGTALIVPALEVPAVVADGAEVDHVLGFGAFRGPAAEPAPAETKRVLDILAAGAGSPADAVAAALERLGIAGGAVGLDASSLTHEQWQALSARLAGHRLAEGAGPLQEARRVKGPYEIECLQRALHLAEEALNAVIQMLEAGVTERAAAAAFETEVIKRGAAPAPALVAMGEGTALPVSWPGDRALRRGDLVRLDVGCAARGYRASVARMAVLGEPRPEHDTAAEAVRAAVEAAVDAIKPGVAASALPAAAAAAARAAGLARLELSRAGHGIGLAAVERPALAAGSDSPLEAGEVLCVEAPYFELGGFGFNLRDTVLVTTGGARVLNRSARGLCVLD